MANPLNLYATKVFAEHPLGLWALDDQLDYISLVSGTEQDLTSWVATGADSIVDATDPELFDVLPPTAPFPDVPVNGIIGSATNDGKVRLTSSLQLQPSDFSTNIKTFSLATYVYTYSKILNVSIGFQYTDTRDSSPQMVLKPATTGSSLAWSFVSETFTVPEFFENLQLIIDISYDFTSEPYEFVVNGITAGQWSEEFHLKSFGVSSIDDIPSEIDILASKGVEAFSYGLDSIAGYYLADSNFLYARNNGFPIVFGSANSTKIRPKTNSPSLIVPGMGFLNESGINNSLTAEFWINIENNSVEPKKIFGPISSDDGIYVEGPFIKIKVGEVTGAHYVGSWNRPMLIDFAYTPTRVTLILNGENVIERTLKRKQTSFPLRTEAGKDKDWLGFYAYPEVPSVLLDSVAVYPYEVPPIIAKRRWVYGQAVEYPNNVKGLNSANSVLIDFPFAKYAKNYYFPSSASWEGGVVENLAIDRENLTPPQHPMPVFSFSGKDEAEWLTELKEAQDLITDPFISLKPNSDWDNIGGHIYYENINFLQEETKAFYGIFETSSDSETREILFELTNTASSNKITIYLENNAIHYVMSMIQPDGSYLEENFYTALGQKSGDRFLVGLDLDRFIKFYGKTVSSFLGAKRKISLFVGGSSKFENTFKGKIRRVAFCNARNLVKIQHFFSARGIPVDYENVFGLFTGQSYDAGDEYFGNDPSYWSLILDGGDPYDFVLIQTEEHLATYTLMPKLELNNFIMDIATNSYWENYVPLSYFAKDVPDAYGQKRRKLDFLQINLDIPKMNIIENDSYNTNGSTVKAYISFQPLTSGANSLQSSFPNTRSLSKDNIVMPGVEWINTKYEVLDSTVVHIPQDIDFESFAIVVHLDISVDGISSNPFKMRSLQISSQAFGASPNPVGTRLGVDIIPFTKKGRYFEYQNGPSFSITKSSTPYLHMTDTSGIKLTGSYDASPFKGLSIPINKSASSFYKLSTIQMCLRYDEELMPQAPVKLFELESADQVTSFYLISDSSDRTRGQIYALNDERKRLQPNLFFFVNGKPTKRGILYPKEWSFISLSFPEFLTFAETPGALRFTSPIMFDNISLYETSIADDEERFGFRQWFSVRNAGGQDFDWGYWAGKELVGDEVVVIPDAGFTWQEVLFLSALQSAEIDAEAIHKIFTGTSRIVVGDDMPLTINSYEYNAYTGLSWSSNLVTAV